MKSIYTCILILYLSLIMPASAESPYPLSLQETSKHRVTRNRILYLIRQGHIGSGLELYHQYINEIQRHDNELIEHMGVLILDQGFESKEPETMLMTLFGAGISNHDRAFYILEEGILSGVPEVQIIAMNLLSRQQNDHADHLLNHCLRSNSLLIRLEAAYRLCQKKHPKGTGQAEALMAKVDPILHPIFPQLFAMAGSEYSINILRKLMANSKEEVRLAAILSAAKYKRDDLLPEIRTLSTHSLISQQEICAVALGELGDEHSIPRLKDLAASPVPSVKLAALHALHKLGLKQKQPIIETAKEKFLPAVLMLGSIEDGEDTLAELARDKDINVRINAGLALLEHQDPRCINPLAELLIRDSRDLAIVKGSTLGRGLPVWKVVSSASERVEKDPYLPELSLTALEEIIVKASKLPEKPFISLCTLLLKTKQNRLIPAVVQSLELLNTPSAVALLKSFRQQAGAPLIRNYCNLALYKLGEEGPYEECLSKWVRKELQNDMIQFRTYVPWEMRDPDSCDQFELTPKETSRLLIEAYEALAARQNDNGIELLLEAIKLGNKHNRYALAGLLIRAAQ